MIEWRTITETWIVAEVQSFTTDGIAYQTTIAPDSFDEYDCACPAFLYDPSEPCKHVELLWERMFELEE